MSKANFLFFSCVVVFIYSVYSIISYKSFFRKAILVKGKIIGKREYVRHHYYNQRRSFFDSINKVSYVPVIEFEYNGVVKTVEGQHYSIMEPAYGKQVSVGINPDNIDDVRLDEPDHIIHMYLAVIITGTAILGFIPYFMVRSISPY